jgi:hypothetical protein
MRFLTNAVVAGTLVLSGGTAAAAAPAAAAVQAASVISASCFGYTGRFLNYPPLHVNLAGGWVECFGIGTNRGIYHAWPNSGGWREMPYGGRADTVTFAYFNDDDQRSVEVYVNGHGYYCTSLDPDHGGWQPWVYCG